MTTISTTSRTKERELIQARIISSWVDEDSQPISPIAVPGDTFDPSAPYSPWTASQVFDSVGWLSIESAQISADVHTLGYDHQLETLTMYRLWDRVPRDLATDPTATREYRAEVMRRILYGAEFSSDDPPFRCGNFSSFMGHIPTIAPGPDDDQAFYHTFCDLVITRYELQTYIGQVVNP